MPMLDEIEWEAINKQWKNGFDIKVPEEERFQPLKELYFELTGYRESNELAIMHHRIDLYGRPCDRCGKPFRTPRALFCAACGWTPKP
jgi:hypothetical protein